MKTRLAAAVIALMLAPGFAMAMCSEGQHASSCKEGFKWDQAKGECVLNPST
jgi:hypothetical protein